MAFRKILFWSHLAAGLVAGLFILAMSVTGVLLTYEHAIISAVARADTVEVPPDGQRLSLDALAEQAREQAPDGVRGLLMSVVNRPDAPVTIYQLGHGQQALDPYTGAPVEARAGAVEAMFHEIVELHRWLGFQGASRDVARALTGAANLVFLFLIVSGLYLWFPKVWKWTFFRLNLFFRSGLPTSKARDYNWHHVFGIWALVPLFVVVATGVVMSYPWANAALYRAFGESPPQRQGPAFMGGGDLGKATEAAAQPGTLASLQQAFDTAAASDAGWTKINLIVPKPDETQVRIMVNNGNGYLAEQRTTHIYSLTAGEIVSSTRYSDMSPAQKARMFVRFGHTGEQFGLIGSTVAGLASLAACFLVYTGFALSWRRLVLPVWRRRRRRA